MVILIIIITVFATVLVCVKHKTTSEWERKDRGGCVPILPPSVCVQVIVPQYTFTSLNECLLLYKGLHMLTWPHMVTSATCLDMSCEDAVVNPIFRWKDKQVVVRLPCGCSTWEAEVLSCDAISLESLGHLVGTCTHAMVQPSAIHGHYSPNVFPCLIPISIQF